MEKCDRCHRHFKPFYWFVKDVDEKLNPDKCYCNNYDKQPHKPTILCKENLQYCKNHNCHFLLEHHHNDSYAGCGEYYDQEDIKSFLCKKCCERKKFKNLN